MFARWRLTCINLTYRLQIKIQYCNYIIPYISIGLPPLHTTTMKPSVIVFLLSSGKAARKLKSPPGSCATRKGRRKTSSTIQFNHSFTVCWTKNLGANHNSYNALMHLFDHRIQRCVFSQQVVAPAGHICNKLLLCSPYRDQLPGHWPRKGTESPSFLKQLKAVQLPNMGGTVTTLSHNQLLEPVIFVNLQLQPPTFRFWAKL